MQSKISSRWLPLIIISIIGIVFFLTIILFLVFNLSDFFNIKSVLHINNQTSQNSVISKTIGSIKSSPLLEQASFGFPVRLKIPEINIDAKIDSVGITFDGAVGAPKNPTNVAWFKLGPRPGENGSAVITGHYGRWKNGGGSVFDNLNKLNPGAKIYIEDEKGTIIVFVVRKLQVYGQNEYVPEVFSSDDEKSYLNLITCQGTWIEAQKTYSDRLVVFTEKE